MGDFEMAVRRLNRDAALMQREIRADSNYRPVHIAGVVGPSGTLAVPRSHYLRAAS
jgi:methionine synthase I (cobalamin-dependent)